LWRKGVKEITLLGQKIVTSYGKREFLQSMAKSPFVQLLEAVHEIEMSNASALPLRIQKVTGDDLVEA